MHTTSLPIYSTERLDLAPKWGYATLLRIEGSAKLVSRRSECVLCTCSCTLLLSVRWYALAGFCCDSSAAVALQPCVVCQRVLLQD
eukprot:358625-Amphidinium_carterae.1